MYASAVAAALEPLPKAKGRARGAGAAAPSGWAPDASSRAGAAGYGGGGGDADREGANFRLLLTHLQRLWDHGDVPPWHRELFAERYCGGGFRSDVLRREAEHLARGTSAVQVAMRAVEARDGVLRDLSELRSQYSDEDFSRPAARRSLADKLQALRNASVAAVEAIHTWRRFVAPLPGQARGRQGSEVSSSVANASARGASWPTGPNDEDYLLYMAHDESVVRAFESVVDLSEDSDPFLLRAGATAAATGKLRPPQSEPSQWPRLERAKMLLLEDEIALSLFSEQSRGDSLFVRQISPPHEDLLRGEALRGGDARHSPAGGGLSAVRGRKSLAGVAVPSSVASAVPQEQVAQGPSEKAPSPRGRRGQSAKSERTSSPRLLPFLPPDPNASSSEQRNSNPSSVRGSTILKKVSLLRGEAPQAPLETIVARPAARQWRRRCATLNPRKNETGGEALEVITELHDLNLHSVGNLRWKPGTMQNGWKMMQETAKSTMTRSNTACPPQRSSQSSLVSSDSGSLHELGSLSDARAPTVDLQRINAAFRRYSMDGYVHQDDICDALKRLGFAHPSAEWVDEAFGQVTAYGTLDPAEFVLFIGAYEDRMREHCLEEFKRYDADSSGFIDGAEFLVLLRDMHIEPMPHVLDEVLVEVDEDKSGHLNFEEFFEVMRLLQEREGFTKTEYDQFVEAFHLYDRDKSGEMDDQELLQALCFLGYNVSAEDAQTVIQEVDFDGTGNMDQHEFLVCMRKLREREMQALKAAMLQHDVDMSGTISQEELQLILYSVGYLPDETVIQEILEDLSLSGANCELNFGMLWQFMLMFRAREGLSRSDSEHVEKAFERYSSNDEVSAVYVSKILRYMGFSMSFDEKQQLVSQVDIDGSGALGLFELRKLFRICREARARMVKAAFNQYGDPGMGVISLKVIHEALRSIGCVQDGRPLPQIAADDHSASMLGGLDMRTFFKVARQQFQELENEVRLNGGYTLEEMGLMRTSFRLYDADNSGTIQNNELVALVKCVFPDMATDPKLRPQLMEIIKESDEDGNGELDFEDFLRLMRTVCELRNRNQLEKEKKAVHETGFLPHEVHDFRELFQAKVGRSMLLSFESFADMIQHICPLGDRNLALLEGMWREALSTYESLGDLRELPTGQLVPNDGGRDCVDFPEFLWIMRQILETNFGQVLQRTSQQRRNGSKSSEPPRTDSKSPVLPVAAAASGAPPQGKA